MEHVIVVLGVWAIWRTLEVNVEASKWFWVFLPLVLSIGGQCLINYHLWWWGFGLWGAVLLTMRLSDLLLVVTDWCRQATLRK